MKSTLWWVLFIVVVFGVGWTSSRLSQQMGLGSSSLEGTEPVSDNRSRRGFGPPIPSLEHLKEPLELSDEQVTELRRIKNQALEEIRGLEHSTREVMRQARERSEALLTDVQKDKLEQHRKQEWDRWKQRKVERHRKWFAEHTALDNDKIAQAVSVVTHYEDQRFQVYRGGPKEERERMTREAKREKLRALTADRDAELGKILSPDEMERFQNAGLDRRRGWGGGRRGGSHFKKDRRPMSRPGVNQPNEKIDP